MRNRAARVALGTVPGTVQVAIPKGVSEGVSRVTATATFAARRGRICRASHPVTGIPKCKPVLDMTCAATAAATSNVTCGQTHHVTCGAKPEMAPKVSRSATISAGRGKAPEP